MILLEQTKEQQNEFKSFIRSTKTETHTSKYNVLLGETSDRTKFLKYDLTIEYFSREKLIDGTGEYGTVHFTVIDSPQQFSHLVKDHNCHLEKFINENDDIIWEIFLGSTSWKIGKLVV